MKCLVTLSLFLSAALPLSSQADNHEPAAATFPLPDHAEHKEHKHKHKKNCGHKSEQHGDHTDYEDNGHHHKQHGKHYDDCHGPHEGAAEKAEKK